MCHMTYGLFDWPVWELLSVTEMAEVEYVTEELVLKLRVLDHRHGTVLCVCVVEGLEVKFVYCLLNGDFLQAPLVKDRFINTVIYPFASVRQLLLP